MRYTLKGRQRWTQKDDVLQLIRYAMRDAGKGMQRVMAETKYYRSKPLVELRRILKREDGLI